MCGTRGDSVAYRGRAHRGERLSEHRSPRHDRCEYVAVGNRKDRQIARGGRRTRWRFRGALVTFRHCDRRRARRFRRSSDHEAWPVEDPRGRATLHPGWQLLGRKRQRALTLSLGTNREQAVMPRAIALFIRHKHTTSSRRNSTQGTSAPRSDQQRRNDDESCRRILYAWTPERITGHESPQSVPIHDRLLEHHPCRHNRRSGHDPHQNG